MPKGLKSVFFASILDQPSIFQLRPPGGVLCTTGVQARQMQAPNWSEIALAAELLLELKTLRVISQCSGITLRAVRLYESLGARVRVGSQHVGAPVLLAQEEVRSTPPIQAATALKHASCDQKSLKNHKKCNSFENWSPVKSGCENHSGAL